MEYEVKYEMALCFESGKSADKMEALRLLEKQGLKPFLLHTPEHLLTAPVIEFMKNLTEDKDGAIFITISYKDGPAQITETINVRDLARRTFQIPHHGEALDNIPATIV